jgi:hypothetical protein
MADKCIVGLQDCMDLEKRVPPAPCSEIYPTSSHGANLAMNIKVEEVSDIEVEGKHVVPVTLIGVKAEQEVSCMSVCPLFGRLHTRPEFPVVCLVCSSHYCSGEWILKSPFSYVSVGLFFIAHCLWCTISSLY